VNGAIDLSFRFFKENHLAFSEKQGMWDFIRVGLFFEKGVILLG